MQKTWLVQGLKQLPKPSKGHLSNAHRVFGGHALGFSDSGWDVVDQLFGLQYMGAAEYEFGALPGALHEIGEARADYTSGVLRLGRTNFPRNYRTSQETDTRVPRDVFYICPKDLVSEVETRIKEIAKDKVRIKNGCRLPSALHPADDSDLSWVGGLDLNNRFFFFVDEPTFKRVCGFFGIEVAEPKKRGPNKS